MAKMTNPSIEAIKERSPQARAAIVFVHGFTGSGQSTWATLAPRIMAEPELESWDAWLVSFASSGWPDIAGVWSADADLNILALKLGKDIADGLLSRYSAIVLIAHSMGGLIVQRTLLDNAEVASKTHAVILMGTPSAGLEKARFIRLWKKQLEGMNKGGEFITKLRSDWDEQFGKDSGFRFLAIAGESDQFVPPSSSIEPFSKVLERVAVVSGNHTSMLDPVESDKSAISLVVNSILNRGQGGSLFDSARVAIELGDFRRVVHELEPNVERLDTRALVQLAIALDTLGEREKAEAYLSSRADAGSDLLGTLGGRLKRSWLLSGRQSIHAEAAENYYKKGMLLAEQKGNQHQIYYHGINLAFLSLTFREDRKTAKEIANKVLKACEACRLEDGGDDWLPATEAEALLILGEFAKSYASYKIFVDADNAVWRISSAYLNASEIASTFGKREVEEQIKRIFSVEH